MSTTNQLPEPDHELAELAAMRKAKKITDYKEFIAYYGKQAAYWEQRLKELDMTETNQLPPSEREAFEAFAQNCPMGKYSIARRGDGYDSSHTQLMWDAWQARAQVQGELEPYDAGLLNDFGGGNVEWWQDYIRAELGRAHDFYQSQITTPQPAQATQAEVKDAEIEALFGKCGGHWSGDQWVIEDADLHPFARTILALRPERVPMTKDAVERAAMYWAPEYRAALKAGIASAEAHHHITAQAKKETT